MSLLEIKNVFKDGAVPVVFVWTLDFLGFTLTDRKKDAKISF